MWDNKDVPAFFPFLRVGSLAHIFADVPECEQLEGPALLLRNIGPANFLGFEPWLVVFSNSTRVELRYVHPFDLIFTAGKSAAAAAVGELSTPASFVTPHGDSNHE